MSELEDYSFEGPLRNKVIVCGDCDGQGVVAACLRTNYHELAECPTCVGFGRLIVIAKHPAQCEDGTRVRKLCALPWVHRGRKQDPPTDGDAREKAPF